MHSLLLSLSLLLQGIPIQAQQGGTISGVLRDTTGRPVAGVRVAAVAVPESPTDAQSSTAMGAIAETDAAGQYRLENIPPGRYYISAGRLDLPTYYPGTQEMGKGSIVGVTAGSVSSQMNFTLQVSSTGRSGPGLFAFGNLIISTSAPPAMLIPIDIRLEDGGKVPAFGPAGFTSIVLEPSTGGPRTAFFSDVQSVRIPGPGPVDYRVVVENLPPGYSVKSMSYDGVVLRSGALHLPSASFGIPAGTVFYGIATTAPPTSPAVHVVTPSAATTNPVPVVPLPPTLPLVITLVRAPVAIGGTQVRGTVTGPGTRSIYLSGKPGILFSDGTFEFRDVPPGRHSIVTLNGSPLATSIVVGDSDLDGVQLVSTPALPIATPEAVLPAGTLSPGTIPLVPLRGSALNQDTQQPIANGMAFLTGGAYGASRPLNEDGTFEFSPLLPGSYNVEIQAFGFETVKRTVVVSDAGTEVRFDAVPDSR